MNFEGNYRFITHFENLKLPNIEENLWYKNNRNEFYDQHKQTTSIIFAEVSQIWDKKTVYRYNIEHNLDKFVFEIVEKLQTILNKRHGKVLLINLPAGCKVEPHIDSGSYLESVRRLHIPIETNENVVFTVGGEEKNMKVGDCIEINNTKVHGVYNQGTTNRIHLLVDMLNGLHEH